MYWTIASLPPVKPGVDTQCCFAAFSLGAPAPQLGDGAKTFVPPVIVPHCTVVE